MSMPWNDEQGRLRHLLIRRAQRAFADQRWQLLGALTTALAELDLDRSLTETAAAARAVLDQSVAQTTGTPINASARNVAQTTPTTIDASARNVAQTTRTGVDAFGRSRATVVAMQRPRDARTVLADDGARSHAPQVCSTCQQPARWVAIDTHAGARRGWTHVDSALNGEHEVTIG